MAARKQELALDPATLRWCALKLVAEAKKTAVGGGMVLSAEGHALTKQANAFRERAEKLGGLGELFESDYALVRVEVTRRSDESIAPAKTKALARQRILHGCSDARCVRPGPGTFNAAMCPLMQMRADRCECACHKASGEDTEARP